MPRMLALSCVIVVCSIAPAVALAAGPDPAAARIGQSAPGFTLTDLDGKQHRLSDYRGRVVVLEWTSHLCPAVRGWYGSGQIPGAIERARDDAVWLAVDSSFFAAHIVDETRAWRAQHEITTACLLDPTGDTGRAYGATCTPQFFVISPTGTLVYKGELNDWRPRLDGSGKTHYLLDAVAAAKESRKPSKLETRAEGCSVKYWDPKWGERTTELEAREMFDWATGYAAENMIPGAFDLLRASLAAGYPRPSDVLCEPRWRYLRDRGASRRTIARALRQFARESSITLVDRLERGDPLGVSGTIRDADGKAVEGAIVYVFHTDHRGLYSEDGMDERNPRLFGFMRTGADGRFEYRTIRPGHYPLDPNPDPNEGRGAEGVEQHVHYEVSAPGFRNRRYRLSFLDDPLWSRTGLSPPRSAAEVTRAPDGTSRCGHDITLERE